MNFPASTARNNNAMTLKTVFGKSIFMALVCVILAFLAGADGGSSSKTPPGMVLTPAGTFWMGSSPAQVEEVKKVFGKRKLYAHYPFGKETPKRKVYLKAYYIDRTEVTNRQYAEFVSATGHRPPTSWVGGKYEPGMDDHPVLFVSMDDASAYAKWAGKRLPTEAEWEKAARGADGRVFPWGDKFDPYKAATADSDLRFILGALCSANYAAGVNLAKGDISPYGARDMAGNVREWTSTRNPDNPSMAIVKGASWVDLYINARGAHREFVPVDSRSHIVGFRCVENLEK